MVKILFKKADCGFFHSEVMSTGDVGNYESTFVSATSRLKRGGGCVCVWECRADPPRLSTLINHSTARLNSLTHGLVSDDQ